MHPPLQPLTLSVNTEFNLDDILSNIEDLWQTPEEPIQGSVQDFDIPNLQEKPSQQIADQRLVLLQTRRQRRNEIRRRTNRKFAVVGGALLVMALGIGSVTQIYASYSEDQAEAEADAQIRTVMFQNVQTKVAAFRKEIEAGEHFMAEHTEPIQYVAKSGDTVNKLAKKFHVSPTTIVKNNDPKKLDPQGIKPGTKLTILPVDGISHPIERHETVAELSKRYDVKVKDIIQANQLENPHMIREQQKIIIPNATELKKRPRQAAVQKSRAQVQGGYSSTASAVTGRRLSWPTMGTVTSNYGWRWFRMHTGMDIAGPVGTPIKAAKEGRVINSGWMGGYGYAIDISHGNGVTTRYAHCSALYVQTGQFVRRGQVIASMGSTGHSTGPHLHFEVRVHDNPVNPRAHF